MSENSQGSVFPLAIITPTRGRWHWLKLQARALYPQLAPTDTWLIWVDNDTPRSDPLDAIQDSFDDRVQIVTHSYPRPNPPIGCVQRARNAAAQLISPEFAIVELDDHDTAGPGLLSEFRRALEAGADYVFAWYRQQAIIEDGLGNQYLEPWPTIKHTYTRGGFLRGDIDAIGPRAFTRKLWDSLGGRKILWPNSDKDFAARAEASGARIVCLEQELSTVTVDADGLCGVGRGAEGMGQPG